MNLPENAFVVRCGGSPADPVTLRERPLSRAAAVHRYEGDGLTLLLRGHLYCHAARTLDVGENLRILAEAFRSKPTLADALSAVAGGLYAVFAVDRRRGVLEAAADRFGCMPLYYRSAAGGVDFTNNPFVFRPDASLSETAVCEYLKYGHLPFSDSLFQGVRRVGPGEAVTVSPGPTPTPVVGSRPYRTYLPVGERVQSPAEGAERLATALDAYFARLGSGRGMAGLSGGYDSRLIAAFTAGRDVSLVNFGRPRSREVRFALRVGARLGKPLESFEIPADAVTRHGPRFRTLIPGLDSFEAAHVLELVERVANAGVSYYLDGFLGDTVIGGNYFYRLGGGGVGLLPNLLLRERFESPVRTPREYTDRLFNSKRAVPDADLRGLIRPDVRNAIRARAERLAAGHLEWCPTHEDVVESLSHATRARCLIAGGPAAVAAYTTTLCPFIDHRVLDEAMACAKHVRAGDRLYNALWRRRFPRLADVPKMNTRGRPRDGDRTYRIKHLTTAVLRRSVDPWLKRLTLGRWDRTEEYSSPAAYVADPATGEYLRGLTARVADRLPACVSDTLLRRDTVGGLSPVVRLRIGSLLAYLD